MSYILDALKKAEEERRRGKGPDILAEPDGNQPGQRKHSLLYAVLILLVAAAGSAGWFMGREKTAVTQIQQPRMVAKQQPVQPAPAPPAAPIEQKIEQKPPQAPAREPAPQPKAPVADTRPASIEKSVPDKKIVVRRDIEARPAKERVTKNTDGNKLAPTSPFEEYQTEKAKPQHAKKTPIDHRIYAFSELPELVRKDLPSFVISTHVYSPEKSERLAAINGRIGREGQEVMPGVSVESITSDGAILRYQGYKFKVGLK
ncbi:MAG TPA: general secretion pathway protein GspB [Dissulfurispiraceae bacterium]|nr:general secretion pathway protein GspB [Dissulfurispiraceae bacterium]